MSIEIRLNVHYAHEERIGVDHSLLCLEYSHFKAARSASAATLFALSLVVIRRLSELRMPCLSCVSDLRRCTLASLVRLCVIVGEASLGAAAVVDRSWSSAAVFEWRCSVHSGAAARAPLRHTSQLSVAAPTRCEPPLPFAPRPHLHSGAGGRSAHSQRTPRGD